MNFAEYAFEHQWLPGNDYDYCDSCGNESSEGHAPACALAIALVEAGYEVTWYIGPLHDRPETEQTFRWRQMLPVLGGAAYVPYERDGVIKVTKLFLHPELRTSGDRSS